MAKDIYLKGTNDDWYEDVTFRLKDNYVNNTPKNLANYADDLISKHMKLKGYTEYQPQVIYSKNVRDINNKKHLYDAIEWFCILGLVFLGIVLVVCLLI